MGGLSGAARRFQSDEIYRAARLDGAIEFVFIPLGRNLRKKGRGRGGGRAPARHHPACLRQDRKAGCSAD